jgi:hypothetical protein
MKTTEERGGDGGTAIGAADFCKIWKRRRVIFPGMGSRLTFNECFRDGIVFAQPNQENNM